MRAGDYAYGVMWILGAIGLILYLFAEYRENG